MGLLKARRLQDTPRDEGRTVKPLVNAVDVIDQTRGRVFPPISKHREVGWKNEAQPSFFKPTSRCLEIGGNTLSSV